MTQVVQHVAEGVSRQSDYVDDWRNRQVYAVQPSDSANNSVYSMNHYDNLDRVVKAERYYDADADGPGSSADAPPTRTTPSSPEARPSTTTAAGFTPAN